MPLSEVAFETFCARAYSDAWKHYGDLNLSGATFDSHLAVVLHKHLESAAAETAVVGLLETLRTRDLYLSCACALPSDKAWRRFEIDYRAYIFEIAKQVSRDCGAADDMARGILAYLFLPDRSGHSRIASYDGQCSLATWLRVVIEHKALNERRQRWNAAERFDFVADVIDEASAERLDLGVRAVRYERMITGALREASGSLSQSDRLLLLWRYDQEIQGSDIARMNGVHPSTITRRLRQLHKQLRNEIFKILANKHRLDHDAIEECIADIMENPRHSILKFLKA